MSGQTSGRRPNPDWPAEPRRVVVTGMGMLTALGNDVPSTWAAMVAGRSGIARVASFDPSRLKAQVAGEVKDFDASGVLDKKDIRRTDRYIQFGLVAARQAMDQAGLPARLEGEEAERTGVILGTGVGGGIAIRQRIHEGPNQIAGEWGHNPLPWPQDDEWPGAACYCGRSGCVETFLSGPGMTCDHERHTGERLAPPDVAQRAAAGNKAAEATLVRYEHRLARALAAIINVLDPDVIVLGGGMSNLERLYITVPALWGHFVFGAMRDPRQTGGAGDTGGVTTVKTRLVRAAHGDSSGVRGAAWLWPPAVA